MQKRERTKEWKRANKLKEEESETKNSRRKKIATKLKFASENALAAARMGTQQCNRKKEKL